LLLVLVEHLLGHRALIKLEAVMLVVVLTFVLHQ